MSPQHSIDFCPICGGGLCGIRICGIADPDRAGDPQVEAESRFARTGSTEPHGLVICDECEALWLAPDLATPHQYPEPEEARCPICQTPLWGPQSRWADAHDIEMLGWQFAVNPDLDAARDQGDEGPDLCDSTEE